MCLKHQCQLTCCYCCCRVDRCCWCASLRTGAVLAAIACLIFAGLALTFSLLEYGLSVPALVVSEVVLVVFYIALLGSILSSHALLLLICLCIKFLLNLTLLAFAGFILLLSVYRGFRHDIVLSLSLIVACSLSWYTWSVIFHFRRSLLAKSSQQDDEEQESRESEIV